MRLRLWNFGVEDMAVSSWHRFWKFSFPRIQNCRSDIWTEPSRCSVCLTLFVRRPESRAQLGSRPECPERLFSSPFLSRTEPDPGDTPSGSTGPGHGMKVSNFPLLRKQSDSHPNREPLLHAGTLGTLLMEGIGSELECQKTHHL